MSADLNATPGATTGTGDIYVLCEARGDDFRPATYELLSAARGLGAAAGGGATAGAPGGRTVAVAVGSDAALAGKLEGLADRVLTLTAPGLTPFMADTWVEALAGVISGGAPRAVLFGESGRTRELLPRLAARLGAWGLSNCVDLKAAADEDGGTGSGGSGGGAGGGTGGGAAIGALGGARLVPRPAFGGKAYVTHLVPAEGLLLAAFRPHSFDANAVPGGFVTAVEDVFTQVGASRVELVERTEGGPRKADLTEAAVVVTGGRGMKGRENFGLLEDLAAALEGAVGYSRALVDAGLADHAYQVGKSGKTVSPTLYIACGVSGAIHHIMGMDTSKVVVAINTDPTAPIFDYADYGVVGDCLQVLPALTEQVRAVTR
ncbi:MAG: electron transfer flavoprotein subunit alpha/FixB family protein [Thermoleophilia bacterium]